MKKKRTSKRSAEDTKKLANMTDEDIDTSEIPEISPEQFADAAVREGLKQRQPKAQFTLRLDRDVLHLE